MHFFVYQLFAIVINFADGILLEIRSSIEKAASKIKNRVPDWSSYEFESNGIYLARSKQGNFISRSAKIFNYVR